MNSKVRHIIYGIISFVLSFILFLLSFAIVLQSTILNPSYIMDNMNTSNYFVDKRDEIKESLVDLGYASGLDEKFFENVVDEVTIHDNTQAYLNSFYAGEEAKIDTTAFKQKFNSELDSYISKNNLKVANDRIIPDCVRALEKGEDIIVRNPHSTRPYQHVLEPLYAYLMIAKAQYGDIKFADCYNVGPDECDCITTGELVDLFVKYAGNINRIDKSEKNAVHEANFLKLDCSKLKTVFGWKPHWHVDDAVKKTVEWSCCYMENDNVRDCMDRQIEEFLK